MDIDYKKNAMRLPLVSLGANLGLAVIKLAAGLAAHSGALLSDSVHSAADVLSDIVLMLGVRMGAKAPDEEHPYGHDRFESAAAIVLAATLAMTGLTMGVRAARTLWEGAYAQTQPPGYAALAVAALCVLCKEALFRRTRFYAVKLGSEALMASAWHHRSDALSSLGALAGIAGARLGAAWLDAAASLMICCLILKTACGIFAGAVRKMVDHACAAEMRAALCECARSQPGVLSVQSLKTREFGSGAYAEIEIKADAGLTLAESGAIAERVHREAERRFPQLRHISVRVSPE